MSAFQYIFDRAENISINRRATVAQTISRSNVVRSVKRGGQVWRFEVKLPDGLPWEELRPIIEALEYADRYTVDTVQINNSGYNDWLIPYLGDATTSLGWHADWVKGATHVHVTPQGFTPGSGAKFLRSGDVIQLGVGGHCYTVVDDTDLDIVDGNAVLLNRPILDESQTTGMINLAEQCTWDLLCTQMPAWTIFARNQVSWSGAFVFYENMV